MCLRICDVTMGLSFVRAGGIALFLGLGQGLGQGLGVGLGLSLGIIYQLYQVRNQQEKPHRQVGNQDLLQQVLSSDVCFFLSHLNVD